MFLNKNTHYAGLIFLLFFFIFASCSQENPDNNTVKPAVINFFNESSFKVDIYKNMNPEVFDPTRLVCTVSPGSTQKVTIQPSLDQVTGDTFYIRYKVLLANSLETGTSNIYVDAQRDLSNITLVIKSDETYTRTIWQPAPGQLKFINGYIKVQNIGSSQIQILRVDTALKKLDDNNIYLEKGSNIGYYEIPLSFLDDVLVMNQLSAFSSSKVLFPSFNIERGKLYSFTVNNSVITDPVISNLDPLRN